MKQVVRGVLVCADGAAVAALSYKTPQAPGVTMRLSTLFALFLLCSVGCSSGQAKADAMGMDGQDPMQPTPITLKRAQTVDAAQAGLLTRDAEGKAVLTLVQRPCRFEGAEPGASFDAQSAEACEATNMETIGVRTQRVLKVPAGPVRIAVSSEQIPYEVGFWLRPAGDQEHATAMGGGIVPGVTKTYEAELKPGTYVYSCPLNPTPDYVLVVE
jgi:hypothetical protein